MIKEIALRDVLQAEYQEDWVELMAGWLMGVGYRTSTRRMGNVYCCDIRYGIEQYKPVPNIHVSAMHRDNS